MDNDIAIDRRQATEEDGQLQPKAFDGLRRRSDATGSVDHGIASMAIRPSAIFNEEQHVHRPKRRRGVFGGAIEVVRKYLKFVGPGFMVAVAYIDPGEPRSIDGAVARSATTT
jgi:metal iron transporter